MNKKMFQKCTYFILSICLILATCGQMVYAQESVGTPVQEGKARKATPKSSMRIIMSTSMDDQSDIPGFEETDVNVTWLESMAIKEPVRITVTNGSKILVEDINDVAFETNGVSSEISNLVVEENSITFMSGQAARGSHCKLNFKVRAPITSGEFKIAAKVGADNAPNTLSNYVEKTFNVNGLTVDTTYDTIYGDTPFDVFGLVNVKTPEVRDLILTLDVYNQETGEMVYELTGADSPQNNTYNITPLAFPDYCEDGIYVVNVTLANGWDIMGSASKTITYVKSKEFTITVKDIVKSASGSVPDSESTREYVYEFGQTINTIQPEVIQGTEVVSATISAIEASSLQADASYNITGIMPIGDVEITYTYILNDIAVGFVDGLVSNELEDPIDGVAIKAYRAGGVEGELGTPVSSVFTNANGKFNSTLTAGLYHFNISKEGYIPLDVYDIEVVTDQTYYLEKSLIVADIPGDGNVTGLVYNAFTGATVPSASINFRKGWNNKTGTVVGSSETNSAGAYNSLLPYGNYTAEFIKNGYITGYVNVICALNYTKQQNATITPTLTADEYRVVLTWGQTPSDLDSHLTGPTGGGRFHVFYSSKSYTQSNGSVANLDVDDTSSYGPETITFKLNTNENGVYRYSIHDFTNSGSSSTQALSLSGAQVKVYKGSQLLATYNVPTNVGGTVWTVFEVDNGIYKPINTFSYQSNPGNVRSGLEDSWYLPEK